MEEFIPIRVSTLRGGQKTSFDLYIKIGAKNILYIRKGDSFEGSRLQRLREKKLRKMFIIPQDESNYLSYLEKNIEMAYDKNSGESLQNRAEIIHGQQQANAEEVMEDPKNIKAYTIAKEGAGKYVNFLLNENEALKTMLMIDNEEKDLAHHSVMVSTLAVGLGMRIGLKEQEHLQILTLGSLLHDIGHLSGNYEVNRPLSEFTPEELADYKLHPKRGAELTEELKHFDRGVVRIIAQHHEFINGSGFPNQLVEKKTDPLAVIVSACESLERLMTYEGKSRSEAVKSLMIDRVGQHPLPYIKQLQTILKELDK